MGHHDTFFKRAFCVPEHAAGEIRSLLPPAVTSRMDLETLRLLPASFVDAQMAHRHADLLFRAMIDGEYAYLYFLFEHQSTPDHLMPFRVLTYILRIWDQLLREDPTRRTLPIIIPIIVHHGAQGWTAPRRLHECVAGLEAFPHLAPLVPDFELIVADLVHIDDEALRARPMGAFPKLALWALRDARSVERLLATVHEWGEEFRELKRQDPDEDDVGVVLRYILRAAGDLSYEVVRDKFIEVIPEVEADMASAAEQLIQRGVARGLKEGRLAARALLTRQLQLRFGALGPDAEAAIAKGTPEQLGGWAERVITAETLEDVFGAD